MIVFDTVYKVPQGYYLCNLRKILEFFWKTKFLIPQIWVTISISYVVDKEDNICPGSG